MSNHPWICFAIAAATACADRDPPPDDMIVLPAGWFYARALDVFSLDTPPIADKLASPQRLPGFAIDRQLVTCSQLKACLKAGVCDATGTMCDGGHALVPLPVADDYCAWRHARLPTFLEWQRAARSTDGRWYPTGDDFNAVMQWCGELEHAGRKCEYTSPDGFVYQVRKRNAEWMSDFSCGGPAGLLMHAGCFHVQIETGFVTLGDVDSNERPAEFRCARTVHR